MNTFKKVLVAIAAAATLGGTALTSTQASAWCGDYGYSSYGYSPYYSYGYGSYGGYEHRDHFRDRFEFRGHEHRESHHG